MVADVVPQLGRYAPGRPLASLRVAVAVIDEAGGVTTSSEQLPFWPFTHQTLEGDLRAAGLVPVATTYAEAVERYMVTARRG